MDAEVVEFDPLADPVRSASDDHRLPTRARLRLILGCGNAVALVGRVHIRRERGKLGGTGIDPLEDRMYLEPVAQRRHLALLYARELTKPRIGEALTLEAHQARGVLRQALAADLRLRRHDLADLLPEPPIVFAGCVEFRHREAQPE